LAFLLRHGLTNSICACPQTGYEVIQGRYCRNGAVTCTSKFFPRNIRANQVNRYLLCTRAALLVALNQHPMSAFSLFASLPNLITLARLAMVPLIISMIVLPNWLAAFLIFLAAGISDGVDGFLAKRFNLQTELGAFLDPVADKALLVSIYVALAITGEIPAVIAILVVSRDVMIVGAFVTAWAMDKPMQVRPHVISKANTAAQITLAAAILGIQAFNLTIGEWFYFTLYTGVAVLSLASLAIYFVQWLRHMEI
jgi:cardiolipin synthase (CMP-forming)